MHLYKEKTTKRNLTNDKAFCIHIRDKAIETECNRIKKEKLDSSRLWGKIYKAISNTLDLKRATIKKRYFPLNRGYSFAVYVLKKKYKKISATLTSRGTFSPNDKSSSGIM